MGVFRRRRMQQKSWPRCGRQTLFRADSMGAFASDQWLARSKTSWESPTQKGSRSPPKNPSVPSPSRMSPSVNGFLHALRKLPLGSFWLRFQIPLVKETSASVMGSEDSLPPLCLSLSLSLAVSRCPLLCLPEGYTLQTPPPPSPNFLCFQTLRCKQDARTAAVASFSAPPPPRRKKC